MLDWLNELIDEYSNQKIDDKRLLRLGRAFSAESAEIMQDAVLSYIRENKYFPRTADLNPYVLAANEDKRGEIKYRDLENQFSYGRFGHGSYSDDDILRWEQQRGTMPQGI
jgi:hypothetical protein